MAFVSRAKWFIYGKKSNKFVLNLNKSRQNQKLINKISNNEKYSLAKIKSQKE
jgi:hypothetical protein